MKRILFFVSCAFVSVQMYAQQSLRINFDVKAGIDYEVSVSNKSSITTNLMGNPLIIEEMKKEGDVYPKFETKDVSSEYLIHWKEGKKNKPKFQLDLVKSVNRSFEGNKQKDVVTKDATQNVATGVSERRGLKYTEVLNEQFKESSADVLTALNELFFNGFGNTNLKVNEVYRGNNKKTVELSNDNIVEVLTAEEMRLNKIVDGKAYFTIDSKISSVNKSTKFAEMNGVGKKEVVYNIDKGFMETMEDTVDIVINITTDQDMTVNIINKVNQKIESKKRQ